MIKLCNMFLRIVFMMHILNCFSDPITLLSNFLEQRHIYCAVDTHCFSILVMLITNYRVLFCCHYFNIFVHYSDACFKFYPIAVKI